MTPPVALTGGHGFLGWHTACRLRAVHGVRALRLGRSETANPVRLAGRLDEADVVIHLAGVNRAASAAEVERGNVAAAEALAAALRHRGRPVRVVFAGSVHAGSGTGYGRGKAAAAQVLERAVADTGGSWAHVVLPNLFGEHGRPAYNSFVATFCHELAAGRRPTVLEDREVPLLHAQRAAAVLIQAALSEPTGVLAPPGEPRRVSDVLGRLEEFQHSYGEGSVIPSLAGDFDRDLFNTFRSFLFPAAYPREVPVHADSRGELGELVRCEGGTGQAYWSTTRPGAVRGEHYHLQRVERFLVVRGEAEIALRRLLHDDVVRFRVSGSRPALVDMPTMRVHRLQNVGAGDLVTLFWTDRLHDPADPDQYPEPVVAAEEDAR